MEVEMDKRGILRGGAGVLAAGLALTGFLAMASARGKAAPPSGGVDPANFTNPQPNPYFPIEPGRVFLYRGTEGGRHLHERLTITHRTKDILGVTTVVVTDVLHADGYLAEKTEDWYAADNDGTVWYFGEDTATYDRKGRVSSREGSWQAGVRGAEAGIIMPANPGPADAYRQEFWRGHAEDQAWIVQNRARVSVAYGSLDHVVRSYEWTRLEPHVVSLKLYAPGLGIVREQDVAGGTESLELVATLRH
jgi:hypothetical protein